MKIYNSLTRKKEPFIPITPGQINIYTCGQTVYNDIHIGNARFYVAFDAIRRYLEYKGFNVKYVQNFTDIDDKIIEKAAQENTTTQELADRYVARTLSDLDALNVNHATIHPRATEEMPEIIAMIKKLITSQNAYEKNGSVYFDTTSVKNYGKLSRKNIDDLIAGARIKVDDDKKNPSDFILWKPAKPGEPAWESPWGSGRPGWHIECSAMAKKYLGDEIDIHGGGSDPIFPHHENEIAQSEAANCCNFARYWMHSGLITANHKKMSKSQGNFQTLHEVAQKFSYDIIRFYLVSGHYRMPMEFTDEVLEAAEQGLERIRNCYRNLLHKLGNIGKFGGDPIPSKEMRDVRDAFHAAMDDDFNTADAVTAIFELVKYINTQLTTNQIGCQPPQKTTSDTEHQTSFTRLLWEYKTKLEWMCDLLGIRLIPSNDDKEESPDASAEAEEIDALVAARQAARASKNFVESDRIRDELTARGIILEDTPQGPRWRKA